MSDAATNVEIEDVLSSIKRLVSEDFRDLAGSSEPASGSGVPNDALVLTADHRIDGAAEPPVTTAEQASVRSLARQELERAITELEALVAEPAAPSVPSEIDASSSATDQPEHIQSATLELTQPDTADDDLDWDAPVGRAMEGAPPENNAAEAAEALSPEETSAALEAVLAEIVVAPCEELQDISETSSDDQETPSIEDVAEEEAPIVEAAEDDYAEAFDDRVTDFRPRQSSPAVESEAFDADVNLGGAPYDALEDPFPAFSTLDHDTQPQDLAIDEDMLRDMVADIVRAELQGELGERITRNVRKLVRREINRALAGQDLI